MDPIEFTRNRLSGGQEDQLAQRSRQLLGGSAVLFFAAPKGARYGERQRSAWTFYCPLCRTQRRLSSQPRPSLRHVAQIGLTAAIFTLLTWSWFEWKGIVSFVPFWAVFETVFRIRLRAALACGSCGFDPYLYHQDIQQARDAVEAFWRRKFEQKGIPYPQKAGEPAPAPPTP